MAKVPVGKNIDKTFDECAIFFDIKILCYTLIIMVRQHFGYFY